MTQQVRLSKRSSMSVNMASKINLVAVTVFVTFFISVSSVQNFENNLGDQFHEMYVSNESYFHGDSTDIDSENIYAGPLKSSDIDEVIIVSRDNVQQLIKTILLAYTHSKDPTMAHLLKSGGLGALKTTFKYLGKEDLGESFLSTAQMFIKDLNLEDEEEKVLGEFAEEYLSKHKFKVVVPESFLLHEKEMVEFLDMKKKMSRKKGRSMPMPEVTEPLELYSVMPYDGKQFSSSIIPGLDLTWIALLGGMLAIPYYFWSEDNNSQTSRKDSNVVPPLPSLSPPRFAPGSPLHEGPRKKNGKRQRRPNGGQGPPPLFLTGAPGNPNQIPSEGDQKAAYDKQYRNWYNNYFYQQFNQLPPGVIPPPGEANKLILPPVNALPPQGLHSGPQFALGVPPFNAAGQVGNPVPLTQQNLVGPSPFGVPHPNQFPPPPGLNQQQFNRNFVAGMVPPPNHFRQNTPENVQDPNRIDIRLSAEQDQQESIQRPQIQAPPSGQLSAPGPHQAQDQLQVPLQNSIEGQPRNPLGNHPARPNSIFNTNQNEQKDALRAPPQAQIMQSEVGLLPPPPPGPTTIPIIPQQQQRQQLPQQQQQQRQQLPQQQQQQQQQQQDRGDNPAPFIPTHVEKVPAVNTPPNVNSIQGPIFINHPQQRIPQGLIQNRRNPQLGHQGVFPIGQPVPWRGFPPPHLQQQQQLRPFPNGPILHPGLQRLSVPGNQNGVANFNGIRGVPQGLQNSLFNDPLLPPPPPGSGEKRDTFGSFRPDREGNSHFKVSFGANEIIEENQEEVEEEEEIKDNEINRTDVNDGVPQASVAQPTVVVIRPQNTIQNNQLQNSQLQKNNILDLSQNFRRFPQQHVAPTQIPQVNVAVPQEDQPLEGLAQNLSVHRQPNLSLQEQKQILQEELRKQQKQSGHILPQHLVNNRELSSERIQQKIQQSQEQEQSNQQSSQQRQSSEQQQQQLQQQLQKQQQQQLLEQRLEQQRQQELQQQQLIQHQQAQIQKQRELQRVSVERQRLSQEQQKETVTSASPSPFHNDHDGFIPIHGPPTIPHGILSKPPVQVPRPSAFLDKLMAEHDEKKSNIEITYAEPLSFSSEVVRIKESSAARPSKEVSRPTPTATPSPTALFIHKPTARTGVPELQNPGRSQSVRVVTSTSVVTSRPVPLGKRFQSSVSKDRDSAKENEVLPDGGEEEDEIFYDDEEKYTTTATPNRGSVKYAQSVKRKATPFDSLEELLPNYEQDYREVLREYQRKQLEPQEEQQVYDQVVKASEQLEHYVPAPQEIIEMNSAGFVNTEEGDEKAAHGEVNRRLKAVSMSVEAADEKIKKEETTVRESKQSDPGVPVYALDPFYGPRLSRIDAIFFQMKLDEDEEGCREQVVCNMYKNPDVYTPLSDFLSRQLTVTLEELQKPQVADERILRFFRYLQAARTGQDGGDCSAKYPKCAHDTTRLSHKPILDAFHKVSDLMNHENFSN